MDTLTVWKKENDNTFPLIKPSVIKTAGNPVLQNCEFFNSRRKEAAVYAQILVVAASQKAKALAQAGVAVNRTKERGLVLHVDYYFSGNVAATKMLLWKIVYLAKKKYCKYVCIPCSPRKKHNALRARLNDASVRREVVVLPENVRVTYFTIELATFREMLKKH